MYLDIEIKADDAVKEILRRTAEELEDLMIDEQVDFVEVRQTSDSLILEMESGRKVPKFGPGTIKIVSLCSLIKVIRAILLSLN
ncbi:MAG: hypothetical protein CM1200mP30_31300 [Pseudomonadota bacterium]|nr:MAG: hypothetical protein CM1200mP30_31300 [Pseudomonadota bacterium]